MMLHVLKSVLNWIVVHNKAYLVAIRSYLSAFSSINQYKMLHANTNISR